MSPVIHIPDVAKVNKDRHLLLTRGHQDQIENGTDKFIGEFLMRSGIRLCNCDRVPGEARIKRVIKTFRDGKQKAEYVCAACGGYPYKVADFSFSCLIIGGKGSGKTTLVLNLADVLHKIDDGRRVVLWQCPDGLISELHNIMWCKKYATVCGRALGLVPWRVDTQLLKGYEEDPEWKESGEKHRICDKADVTSEEGCLTCPNFKDGLRYFQKIENLEDVQYNDVLVIDEGIISINAKEALSKKMRDWSKLLAVLRHKRIILFALAQRYDIIKSIRELTDMIVYKKLPDMMIDEEKADYFLKSNKETITKLEQWESIVNSKHPKFSGVMKIINHVPEWYSDAISQSYDSEYDFLTDKAEKQKELDLVAMMGHYVFENYTLANSDDRRGIKDVLRREFFGYSPAPKMINDALDHYYALKQFETPGEAVEVEGADGAVAEEAMQALGGRVTQLEYNVFLEWARGRAVTQFNEDPFNLSKNDVTQITRKVAMFLLNERGGKGGDTGGDEAEKFAKKQIWETGGFAVKAADSGGLRADGVPAPDLFVVTKQGQVQLGQVKMRNGGVETFQPTTFDTELYAAQRLSKIAKENPPKCPHCGKKVSHCPDCRSVLGNLLTVGGAYFYGFKRDELGTPAPNLIMEHIQPQDNKMTIRVDYERKTVSRQEPDMERIKSPKLRDFLLSNEAIAALYYKNSKDRDEKMETIVSFDKLLQSAEEEGATLEETGGSGNEGGEE